MLLMMMMLTKRLYGALPSMVDIRFGVGIEAAIESRALVSVCLRLRFKKPTAKRNTGGGVWGTPV